MWQCCVCWIELKNHKLFSFATKTNCHTTHVLCRDCYSKCTSCPLCRYTPKNVKNQSNF